MAGPALISRRPAPLRSAGARHGWKGRASALGFRLAPGARRCTPALLRASLRSASVPLPRSQRPDRSPFSHLRLACPHSLVVACDTRLAIESSAARVRRPPQLRRVVFRQTPDEPTPIHNEVALAACRSPNRRHQRNLSVLVHLDAPRRSCIANKAQLNHITAAAWATKECGPNTLVIPNLINDVRLNRVWSPQC